jgi:hypothetical protein
VAAAQNTSPRWHRVYADELRRGDWVRGAVLNNKVQVVSVERGYPTRIELADGRTLTVAPEEPFDRWERGRRA